MLFICSLLLIAGCNNSPKQTLGIQPQTENATKLSKSGQAARSCSKCNLSRQTIQYRIDSSQYAVVVVQKGGVTSRDAKQYAMEKAAAMARQNNFRYFTVELEEKVFATDAQSRRGSDIQMPRNMYYELIQSDNFGKAPMVKGSNGSVVATYPAYRMVIKCYKERPIAGAIDVRELPVNYR